LVTVTVIQIVPRKDDDGFGLCLDIVHTNALVISEYAYTQ